MAERRKARRPAPENAVAWLRQISLAHLRLALLGGCAAAFQTLFSRAFFADFAGNEVVVAALLGPWLLLTALGATLGRAGARRSWRPFLALLLYGPLAAATIVAARILPRLFPAGASPGAGVALLWATVLLAPCCVLSGLTFSWLAGDRGGRAYSFESFGSAAAGAALSLFLLGRAPSLAIVAGVTLASTIAAALGCRRAAAIFSLVFGSGLAVAIAAPPLTQWSLSLQGGLFHDVVERDSASSSIVVARSSGEVTVFTNRLPIATRFDLAGAEEAAHLPLSLHPAPRSVAVIGVAPTGTLAEMTRHGVSRTDVLVEDEGLLSVLQRNLPDSVVTNGNMESGDARRFLGRRAASYDAILLFSPEPTSALLNRSFTAQFFGAARAALAEGGIVAVAMPGHASQTSRETRRLHSSVARTLSSIFGPVLVLPAGRTFYVAAVGRDLPRQAEVVQVVVDALDARRITPTHLSAATLANLFTPRRLSDAERWASLPEAANQDLAPTTYRIALDRILAEFGDAGGGVLLALAAAIALGVIITFGPRSRPVELAVLTSGASGLATQLVIMLAYQIATGALYREIGLLLAGFMAGSATGALVADRSRSDRWVIRSDILQVALPLALWLLIPSLLVAGPFARGLAFFVTALAGFLPGAQFAAALHAPSPSTGRTAGTLYSADLIGAALAALATFTVLVPAMGVRGALLAIAGVKLMSSIVLLLPSRAAAPSQRGRLAPAVPLAFAAAVLLAAGDRSYVPFYALTFERPYQVAALVIVLASLTSAFDWRPLLDRKDWFTKSFTRLRVLLRMTGVRLVAFAGLLPVGAFPLGRCYFQVPFLFCHACPRPCIFGVMRPYAVPAALVANLFDRTFCERICPLGTAQSACAQLRRRKPWRARGWLVWGLRLLALGFAAAGYFWIRSTGEPDGSGSGNGFHALLYTNAFTPSTWVLVSAAALMVISFFVRRPFCEVLCPIGTAATILTQAENRLLPPRREAPGEESADG